jgi:8-oxo-dGTP pyrophosphatase MutT (NUDIX family)
VNEAEQLAVFDGAGNRVGVKSRAAVHRDHDWHWLVFVWSAYLDPAGEARTLLQIRARPDDPFVGNVDAIAAGHVQATESHLEGARREFQEEVGVAVKAHDLLYLESKPLASPTGKCRRVVQHFYLCKRPIELRDVRFSEEVNGFVEVAVKELVDLLEGRLVAIRGLGRTAARADFPVEMEISTDSFSNYAATIVGNFRRSMRQILDLPDLQARST